MSTLNSRSPIGNYISGKCTVIIDDISHKPGFYPKGVFHQCRILQCKRITFRCYRHIIVSLLFLLIKINPPVEIIHLTVVLAASAAESNKKRCRKKIKILFHNRILFVFRARRIQSRHRATGIYNRVIHKW